MFYSLLSRWGPYTAFAAAMMTGPLAYAAPPMNDTNGVNAISSLQFGATQLNTSELGAIRGGFDLSPKLSINFAFQQIDYQGTNIIQSIMVPMTTLTQATHNATAAIISSNGAATFMQSGVTSAQSSVPSNVPNNTPAQPNSSESVSNSNNATYVPANASNIAVTSTANNGQSVVLSQLGNGAITNIIMNQANNTLLSQVTNVNIDISGMSQWLSQQRGSHSSSVGAFSNPSFSH